jgi:cyclopropane fatty-acyl-phospholipid synthase-like methyltransferase
MSAEPFYKRMYSAERVRNLRRYPHDEMMRFLGRHFFNYESDDTFFHFERPQRRDVRILEVGCGGGSNLWAIAKEGFRAYGIDTSAEGIALCREMLSMWGTQAEVTVGDMRDLRFADLFFDCIIDIYSSCCLGQADFERFLQEISRTLKPGGKFYCWNPSDRSEAFLNHAPAKLIEPCTLDGIKRETSPFFGNNYTFRFLNPESVTDALQRAGLAVLEIERTGRTYRQTNEYFEWLSVSAAKPA